MINGDKNINEAVGQRIKNSIREVPDFPKVGIGFKDVTPLLLDPELSRAILSAMVDYAKGLQLDAIVGVDSRGFLFGPSLARELDIPFVLVRKKGKLPADTVSVSYDLEYGSATLEMHKDAIKAGDKVLIHDDLLATGGTAQAAGQLVEQVGATVSSFLFVVDLVFLDGKKLLDGFGADCHSLAIYEIWFYISVRKK